MGAIPVAAMEGGSNSVSTKAAAVVPVEGRGSQRGGWSRGESKSVFSAPETRLSGLYPDGTGERTSHVGTSGDEEL